MDALVRGMSAKQHAKIDEAFRQNVDRFIDSDSFHAFLADMSMFGDKAFSKLGGDEDAS